jgi:RNA polymerase sigma-70 factor (sigma-E family)
VEGPRRPGDDFRAFFQDEHARLLRALYLVTGDPAEAEDLAQEALVRVFERWDRVRAMASPVGYLYRTALNLNRTRLRRLAFRARRGLGVTAERAFPDPAVAAEARDDLGRALASLSAGQRAALVLVEWLGLPTDEAAQLLGITPVTVRVRLSRARATLRERLGGSDD